jgi:hypothetical protein
LPLCCATEGQGRCIRQILEVIERATCDQRITGGAAEPSP